MIKGEHSHHGNQGNSDMKDYESENEFIEATHQGNGGTSVFFPIYYSTWNMDDAGKCR